MTTDEIDSTEAFFSATDQLQKIYQWARARYAAPWAVFGAVLLRVAASVGPHVQLPGLIGGRASLNLLCAFVSTSGGGKGISDKVARLAWPTPIIELPIGSGEGIAAAFKAPDKPDADNEPITAAIFNIPEIDTLAGIASRQGSILLAQLKSMAMGEQLGQSNASKATSRIVAAHTYRCCLSVGAQPGHTGVIFDDTTGGTPQRFLWFPTTDAGMPVTKAPDPGPLDTAVPFWAPGADGVVEIGYGPAEIAETVIAAHIARQRGEADALDGHAMLTRCKVAAALAILHHRSVVSELDWQLSKTVMMVSDATRSWIVTEAKKADQAKVRDRALARMVGEEVVDQRRLEVVKRRIRKALSSGRRSHSDTRRQMGKAEYRELFEMAITELAEAGEIRAIETDKGTQYETTGSSPVNHEFTPHTRSSEGVNREFTGEPDATVTDLDTRRSHDSDRPKMSATAWLAQHVIDLRNQGHTTVKTFAVLDAGEAEGYRRGALSVAASKHPDITVIDRSAGTATWSIAPGHTVAYRSAPEWVHSYLDGLPDDTEIVDRDHFRSAATAAGHEWATACNALRASGRIESVPPPSGSRSRRDSIWRITPANEETA